MLQCKLHRMPVASSICLFMLLLFFAFSVQAQALKVALYPYVPDSERFKSVVTEKWKSMHPEKSIEFVDGWDCYEQDPPDDVDVFVFDALYLSRFVDKGYLLPFEESGEIVDLPDYMDFSITDCRIGGKIFALPQLLCTNLLYYRSFDTSLSDVKNVYDLARIVEYKGQDDPKKVPDISIVPSKGTGLLADVSGGTTKVCTYLEALIDEKQRYDNYDTLPDIDTEPSGVAAVIKLRAMAGAEQADFQAPNDDSYIRSSWYIGEAGRAYIGYSEAMSSMGSYAGSLKMKLISLSNKMNIPTFYCDLVGVNAKTKRAKEAKEFAVLLTDKSVLKEAIYNQDTKRAQYLLPARKSVYKELAGLLPVYSELEKIVCTEGSHILRAGKSIREWMPEAKEKLKKKMGVFTITRVKDYEKEVMANELQIIGWDGKKYSITIEGNKMYQQEKDNPGSKVLVETFQYITNNQSRWRCKIGSYNFYHYLGGNMSIDHADSIIIYKGWDETFYTARFS